MVGKFLLFLFSISFYIWRNRVNLLPHAFKGASSSRKLKVKTTNFFCSVLLVPPAGYEPQVHEPIAPPLASVITNI
jgi:hypothetical protein